MASSNLESRWRSAPQLPLAAGHPENIITPESLIKWSNDLESLALTYPHIYEEFSFSNGLLNKGKLIAKYETELRFLSRSTICESLNIFAKQILNTFDPKDTLFYYPVRSGSTRLFHDAAVLINPDLGHFGIARGLLNRLLVIERNKFFPREANQAKAVCWAEDWILSGDVFRNCLIDSLKGKFHTFHIAVSDAGYKLMKAASKDIFSNFLFSVRSPKKTLLYGEYPVYGSHKVPDNIPDFYAALDGTYSIFGNHIAQNQRLMDHPSQLLNSPGSSSR